MERLSLSIPHEVSFLVFTDSEESGLRMYHKCQRQWMTQEKQYTLSRINDKVVSGARHAMGRRYMRPPCHRGDPSRCLLRGRVLALYPGHPFGRPIA